MLSISNTLGRKSMDLRGETSAMCKTSKCDIKTGKIISVYVSKRAKIIFMQKNFLPSKFCNFTILFMTESFSHVNRNFQWRTFKEARKQRKNFNFHDRKFQEFFSHRQSPGFSIYSLKIMRFFFHGHTVRSSTKIKYTKGIFSSCFFPSLSVYISHNLCFIRRQNK